MTTDPAIHQAAAALGAKGGRKRAKHPRRRELARAAGLASGKARRKRKPALPKGSSGLVTWREAQL